MDIDVHRPSLVRRTAHGLGSQGLSSISNFALVVVLAHASSPQVFGAFAIGYSIGLLLLGVSRSAIGGVLAVTEQGQQGSRFAVGAALIISAATGLLVIGVGLVWPHELLRRWLVLFGAALPLLVWQDSLRSVAFATHRPAVAAVSDGVWVAFQGALWTLLAVSGRLVPELVLAVWVLGAGAGAAIASSTLGGFGLAGARQWLADHLTLLRGFAVEAVLSLGSPQAAVYAVGLVVGLPAAGALRGAQSLFGPVRALLVGVSAVALPEAAGRSRTGRRRYLYRLSGVLTAGAGVVAAGLSTIPDDVGRLLLSETWATAAPVMPAVGIAVVATAAATGPMLGLRAAHDTGRLMFVRLAQGTSHVLLGVTGALWVGLIGAAYGLALVQVGVAVAAWLMFTKRGMGGSDA